VDCICAPQWRAGRAPTRLGSDYASRISLIGAVVPDPRLWLFRLPMKLPSDADYATSARRSWNCSPGGPAQQAGVGACAGLQDGATLDAECVYQAGASGCPPASSVRRVTSLPTPRSILMITHGIDEFRQHVKTISAVDFRVPARRSPTDPVGQAKERHHETRSRLRTTGWYRTIARCAPAVCGRHFVDRDRELFAVWSRAEVPGVGARSSAVSESTHDS